MRALESPRRSTTVRPLLVVGDDVVRWRATSALAQGGHVALIASFTDLEPEGARPADAFVIACRAKDHRAAAIRAARISAPEANIIVLATAEFDEGPQGGGEPVELISEHVSDAVSSCFSAGRLEHRRGHTPGMS
jgi:hypothetical protein